MNYVDQTIYYNVFHRTWWKLNPDWPSGFEPYIGPRQHIQQHLTYKEALALCKKWNDEHNPGPLSDKAEFEEE